MRQLSSVESIRVYVNGEPVDVAPGTTAIDAIGEWDPAATAQIHAGTRMIVDNRGLPAQPDSPVYGGAIFRVVSGRQGRGRELENGE
jgi:hypothetical protein